MKMQKETGDRMESEVESLRIVHSSIIQAQDERDTQILQLFNCCWAHACEFCTLIPHTHVHYARYIHNTLRGK